jgi:hypothetical protein
MRSSAASYVTRELELRLLPARDALPYMPFDVWRPDGDCILRGYVRGVYWRGRQRANFAICFTRSISPPSFILLAAEFSPLGADDRSDLLQVQNTAVLSKLLSG